jgi:DNA-binding response OmpR family regulator
LFFKISKREFEFPVRDAGRALTLGYLTECCTGNKAGVFDRTIDVHISNLRKKLHAHRSLDHIKTVRSGYLPASRRPIEEF